MRKTLRTLAMAVAALTVVAAAAAPAAAGPPGTLFSWRWIYCTPGTSNSGQVNTVWFQRHDGGMAAYVTGLIDPCVTPEPLTVFALAEYRADGTANGIRFQEAGYGAEPGTLLVDTRRFISPDTHSMCLISNETTRLACFGVTWQTVNGLPTAQYAGPVPVDSPLVSAPARTNLASTFVPMDPPECGYCPG